MAERQSIHPVGVQVHHSTLPSKHHLGYLYAHTGWHQDLSGLLWPASFACIIRQSMCIRIWSPPHSSPATHSNSIETARMEPASFSGRILSFRPSIATVWQPVSYSRACPYPCSNTARPRPLMNLDFTFCVTTAKRFRDSAINWTTSAY
jgi:hypothetical protein